MPKRPDPPAKKPSGGRPAPRRLFSLDALRKDKTNGNEISSQAGHGRSKTLVTEKTLSEVEEDPFADTAAWTEKPLVTSPVLEQELAIPRVGTPPTLELSRSKGTVSDASLAPPPSPSRRRWDTIRLHVLPSSSSPSIDSVPLPSPPPDGSSIPARPSTPKLPRFGYKKAFRQVVENVQVQQAGDNKRFADAIRVACWNARFGDAAHPIKPEREGTLGAVGSSLHLPFMASTTSLTMMSSSSASTIQATGRSGGLRRPPSVQSLTQFGGNAPSIVPITRVLSSFSTAMGRPLVLPYETLLLSTLLLPFLDPRPGTQQDMEQSTAVEAFEYAVRTWKAPSREIELERCLWCCRAASVPSRSRLRVLGTLSSILFSRDRSFQADSPIVLQTLLQALFSLQYTLSLSSHSSSEMESLAGYVAAIRSGSCGELSAAAIEMEYGVRFTASDNEATIRGILVTESLIQCLSAGNDKSQRWMLNMLLQEYWPVPEPNLTLTPLLSTAHWRKLQAFLSSALGILSQPSDDGYPESEMIVRLLRTRIVAEVAAMRDEEASEIRRQVIRLMLELLSMQGSSDREHISMYFSDWYQRHTEWKDSIEGALQQLVRDAEWSSVLRLIPAIVTEPPEEIQISLLSFVLPLINNRLVADPPEAPCLALTRFLNNAAQDHPKLFFKPLFACAAANKDLTVVNQLSILTALAKFLPDLWVWDADMMSVALLSDATGSRSTSDAPEGSLHRSKPRLGQCALLMELLDRLHSINECRDLAVISAASRFVVALETRLSLVIAAKEKSSLLARSHQLLFCALFREIRLLTRSLRSAPWLETVLSWVLPGLQLDFDADLTSRETDEVASTLHKLQAIYVQAQEASHGAGKRRNTAASIFSLEKKASERSEAPEAEDIFTPKRKRLEGMLRVRKTIPIELFVLVSSLLGSEHYVQLGPLLWSGLLNTSESLTIAPRCFLIMQFAEKRPEDFTSMVENQLSSESSTTRQQALYKLSILASWRFQILSQEVLLDRAHRRPFKLQRPQIMFVATDIGSSLFVYEDDNDEYKDINGHVVPLELRRRLSEIGWAQEDRVVDRRVQRVRTPMTLLPNQQLERVDFDYEESPLAEPPSPSPSPEPSPTRSQVSDTSLARRDSIASGRSQGVKRRPVFVQALVALFPKVASLVNDRDLFVAQAAQDLLLDFMRDDPSLLSRTIFHLITGDTPSVETAFSTLSAFMHTRHILPPNMTHHILNHLTGFLKTSVRNTEWDALRGYGYSLPIIARLVTQVSKMSMREIRRAKIDMLLVPSGSLWFPPSAPAGPLFPRFLEPSNNPFECLPPSLVSITLIRTSQNMLFLKMLKRNPQDVKVIRKTMTRLALPSLSRNGDDVNLTLMDTVPLHEDSDPNTHTPAHVALTALSLTLARSYLLLVEQVFQCMSRHLNDREELASLVDGLNRILMAHGNDIGIVAHTMLALMTATTRFKRLFLSGGYTLFMPAIMKVYVESEYHSNIRYAIEYAASRFYALHHESFIFQTFDVMAQVLSFSHADAPWIVGGIYALFTTLKGALSTSVPDAAGIHNLNKAQEQEALMVSMAEEVPQAFISSFRRASSGQERSTGAFPLPEEYEGKRLRLDDLVRLFLTVIAHDSGIQRAEQFLKFLRLLTPHLYSASRAAQNVLRGGIDALGGILVAKSATKQKSSEVSQSTKQSEEYRYKDFVEEKTSANQRLNPSDLHTMRLEYLLLVLAYTGAGGSVVHQTTLRIIEVIKAVMKEDNPVNSQRVSKFLAEYARTVLLREDSQPAAKDVVVLLSALVPITSAYATKTDFDLSELFDILVRLASNPVFISDPTLARLMVSQYCRIGLDACEVAASADILFSFPLRSSVIRLLNCLVSHVQADVMEQIEGRVPTHEFLAGIVLPMVLTLKTSAEVMADSQFIDAWRRDAYSKVWMRLLAYVISACEQDGGLTRHRHRRSLSITAERQKSQGNQASSKPTAPLMGLCIALQVLKVIVVRAEEDISSAPFGLWTRISAMLKTLLADGDAKFALRSGSYSEPPSPAFSPRVSTFQEQQQPLPTFPSTLSSHSRQTMSSPRMVDYLTWSMIQWMWLRRTPLMLPMRIFVQERIANLAADLRLQGSGAAGGGSRSRPVSTVFSKPRKSMFIHSPASSTASTPRNSTLIPASISLPVMSDFTSSKDSSMLQPGRLAGYARMPSPISPSGRTSQEIKGQKIVHLGPVSQPSISSNGLTRPVSLGSDPGVTGISAGTARALARDTLVRSHVLIRMTYRRIRLVQHLMGYTDLLPLGGSEYSTQDGLDAEMKVWSNRTAIEAVVDETKELLAEFKGGDFDLGDESLVYIDSQEFLLPSGSQES